ncbi:LysR family transcriptional regulator substrate-binding protein [Limosilactobacillus fermentum]
MADKRLFILAQPDFPKTKGFQLLTRFMQGHREIKVSFATRTAHLAAALATGECDLIFAAGLTNQAHALITDQEPYLAVLPTPLVSQLGLSMATTVSLDQLAEQDLLLPSQGHPLRRELDANFKMAGTPLPSVEEEDALDLRLTKVAQFLGATLAPQSSLPTELPAGCQLFGLSPALLSSQGFLAPAQPSETARGFLEWLQEQSGQ